MRDKGLKESEEDERNEIVKKLEFRAVWQKRINSGFRETDGAPVISLILSLLTL